MRTLALDIFHKRRNIDWHPEQHGTGGVELHVDVLEDSGALPDVAREVHGLLWCTSALDRHDRLREQRAAALELRYQAVGIGSEIVAVVRGDAVAPQRELGRASCRERVCPYV